MELDPEQERPFMQLSRRKVLRAAGLAGLALPVLAACAGTQPAASPSTQPTTPSGAALASSSGAASAPASAKPAAASGSVAAKPSASAPGASATAAGSFPVVKPEFSLKERDRRWAAVRAVMGRAPWNLDAILVPGMSDQAYTRYLSQVTSADMIFPRDGSKKALVLTGGGRNMQFWQAPLKDWLADGKMTLGDKTGSRGAIDGLKSLGLDAAGTRIGVAKLSGSRFDPEGLVSATYLDAVKKALPGVAFVGIEQWGADPGPVDAAAMVKSDEEQAAVKRAIAAGEKTLQALAQAASSAKTQAELWFATFSTMFQATGEEPTRVSLGLDVPANFTLGVPTADAVKEGQIVSQELDNTVQGYRAQVNHSIFIGGAGTPGYDYYAAAMKAAVQAFTESIASIVPGKTTCGELSLFYAGLMDKLNAEDQSGVVLHSSGIGNLSRPRVGPDNSKEDHPIVLVSGMTFDFKPALRLKRGAAQDVGQTNRQVQVGDHVLITDKGAVRLGSRDLGPFPTRR